jgi:large subunit ribosomal protein L13
MEREKHTIDAKGEAVGRLASRIAIILRGKDKPEFEPHIDNGSFVEVVNHEDVKFSGDKWDQKKYYNYSGYRGGMRERKAKELTPKEVIEKAVWNMLPKNKLRKDMFKRLVIKDQ